MALVSIWSDDGSGSVPKSRVLLVKGADAEILQYLLDEGNINEVDTAYKLLENGYGFEGVILDYLALKFIRPNDISSHRWESTQIKLWHALIKSIDRLDINAYYALADEFVKHKAQILPGMEILKELLDEVAICLILPYVTLSPYDGLCTSLWEDAWWKKPSPWIARLSALQKKLLQFTSLKFTTPLLKKIELIQSYLKKIDSDVGDDLLLASAFCFNAARINRNIRNNNIVLQLIHRSLDLYLLAVCVDNKLTHKSVKGRLEYLGQLQSKLKTNKISITNSMILLEDCGILSSNSNYSRQIAKLNLARNRLIYTHGIYSVYEDDLDDFIQQVQSQITSIDGDSKWKKMLGDFKLFISIPIETIFEFEDSFDTYVVKIFQR